MKLCKKIIRIATLAFIILMLVSSTVLAAYSYYATVQVQETGGNPYSYLPVIADIDNDYLATNGYISITGLDTRILSESTPLEHLVTDDKVLFVIPLVEANSTGNYRYTLGNELSDDFPIIVGYSTGANGYITIDDDDTLDGGAGGMNDFEIEVKGWVDTVSGEDKNIVNKEDAFKLWVSDTEEVSAGIYDTSTNMRQQLISGDYSVSDVSTSYEGIQGRVSGSLTEALESTPIPTDGTLSSMKIDVGTAPGFENSWTFTLRKNEAPTAMVVVISGSETTGSYSASTIDVTAGDLFDIEVNPDSDPSGGTYSSSILFESDTAQETVILGSQADCQDVELVSNIMGGIDVNIMVNEERTKQIVPSAGTFKKLFVALNVDPGVAPEAYRFTLRKNGVDTGLTVTITANDTAGSDLVNTVAFSAGDKATMHIENLNSPTVNSKACWGMIFVPAVDGDSIACSGMSWEPSTSNIVYTSPIGNSVSDWTVTEGTKFQIAGRTCWISDFYVQVTTAPGAGKSYEFNLLRNSASTALSVTIADTSKSGSYLGNEVVFYPWDAIQIRSTPSGTPAAVSTIKWGFIIRTSDIVSIVTVTGVSSGVRTAKTFADGTDLFLEVYDENGLPIGNDTASLDGGEVPEEVTDWILSENNVMPYMEYYKHTVADTLIAWYQPVSMIIGTTLDDREGTDAGETGTAEEDGTITWGANPANLSATVGSLISSDQPEIVPASEEEAVDIVPEGEVPVEGGVVNVGKLDNNPLYFIVEIASEYTEYTEEQIWFIGATFIILIGMGIAAIKVPNHMLLAGTVGLVLGGFFTAMEIYQWWMMLIFGFMFIMSILMERKPVL